MNQPKYITMPVPQTKLYENVEYAVFNRPLFIKALAEKGIKVSKKNYANLEAIEKEALQKADTPDIVAACKEKARKQVFQENPLTAFLLKKGFINPKWDFVSKSPLNRIFGKMADYKTVRNLVTSAGKAGAASRLNGSGGEAAFTFIAIGTGTNAAAAGDTTLQTESTTNGSARAAATASRVTTTVTNDTAQLVLTFNLTGTFAFTESGLLNASSAGVLLCRQTFTAVNVVSGDSLQITWKVQCS